MKVKYQNIIGIDPDCEKSGACFIEFATRKLKASALTFPNLMDYLQFVKKKSEEAGQSAIVVVEAGWMNTISNYHTKADRAGQRIAKNVGANHEVGKKIVEMAKHYGLEVVEQRPFKKCWKGRDGKITQDELDEVMQNAGLGQLDRRVSQDVRDAVLMTILFANLPIRIKA